MFFSCSLPSQGLWRGLGAVILCLIATPFVRAQDGDLSIHDLEIEKASTNLALYHPVDIVIKDLPAWVEKGNDPTQFKLFIDGFMFPDSKPHLLENNTKLRYDLTFETASQGAVIWKRMVSKRAHNFFKRQVAVTVGLAENQQVKSQANSTLILLHRSWFLIYSVCLAMLIVFFIRLAKNSDIIRDNVPEVKGTDGKGRPFRKPFSLARTQMAIWLIIVVASFMFIWMVSGDPNTLTNTVLSLIGISTATGLSSVVVDQSNRNSRIEKEAALKQQRDISTLEVAQLNKDISDLDGAANLTARALKETQKTAKSRELLSVETKISSLETVDKPPVSQGFLLDLLSNGNGVSFHRFQIVVWTITLIFIFLASVYNQLAMPDFNATLLSLMGISGGTYVGFKIPEREG